jgi:ribonuclease E
VPSVALEAADGDPEARKRRRRRGGRGRGRTRREDETTPAVATGEEEIGWEEFDDLAQLDGAAVEEREYTFEEADAATLAELGLSADDLAELQPAPAPDEAPQARRRSTRARQPVAEEVAAEDKPKRTRSTRAKQPDADAAPAADKPKRARSSRAKQPGSVATEADAPKPRRRSAAASADAPGEAPADRGDSPAEPQGIWGRFRSARKPRTTAGG